MADTTRPGERRLSQLSHHLDNPFGHFLTTNQYKVNADALKRHIWGPDIDVMH
jgi:hypothetical protein